MTTNFPSGLDAFTNPSATDAMDSVTVPHATQHADLNDAVEALEAKVGVDSSAVTTSLDYKVANQGLTFIKSATVGSSVSSVTVTDAFNSTFDSYKIVYHINGGSSTAFTLLMTLGSVSTGYYYCRTLASWSTGSISSSYGNNGTFWAVGAIRGSQGGSGSMDIHNPFTTELPAFSSNNSYLYSSGYGDSIQGYLSNTTSQTAFTFAPSGGTMTGGTIRVYGYNNGA